MEIEVKIQGVPNEAVDSDEYFEETEEQAPDPIITT